MYEIQVARKAAKSLKELPEDYKNTIKERLKALESEPRPHGSIALTGRPDCYRIRIGPFRIQYQIIEKSLLIYKIGRRDESTYR